MTERRKLGGFERGRGETQTPGSPNVYGVNPRPGPIPIGPAPPFVRQVISEYDSRPIGGYDFVLTASFTPYLEVARPFATSPFGYITVVRRIELDTYPGIITGGTMLFNFAANGVVSQSWDWTLNQVLLDQAIDTFFVVPPNTLFGLVTSAFLAIQSTSLVVVRYIGNLILDTNEPPNEQVGSLPHTVYTTQKEF